MKSFKMILMTLSFCAPVGFVWAAPADAPAGATATCKDGSYYSGSSKRGACSRHGGIKDWYGAAAATAPAAPAAAATQQQPATAPMGPPASQPAQQTTNPPTTKTAKNMAPGGGAGQVWVNTQSKVYHCPGTRWYGTTKQGEYMSESQARSQGIRPDHNKPCSN